MKYQNWIFAFFIAFLTISSVPKISAQTSSLQVGINRIEGRVVGDANSGVDAYVELYDNYGTMIGRQRATGSGRFNFRGMTAGRYVVAVKPYGTNFLEDSREIEINNQTGRSDTVIVEFRLRLDKRYRDNTPGILGTIYAQEVPDGAKKLYDSGVENLKADPEKAKVELEAAIKAFPQYFNALSVLGKSLVAAGKYQDGYPYLLKALDVNAKCSDCLYSLAIAFYKLDELPAANKAISEAAKQTPQVSAIHLVQGIILRLQKDLPGAEKALLLAKSLAKTPNPEIHYQLSFVYNRQGRNTEAADELEAYLKYSEDLSKEEKESTKKLIAKMRNKT
ncbi:MAG TPA: tetratricopeptide repeat protein [Pyrinomonadaceae bacterium]|nr:tetratricopeptide repeat protein [Pyrinomonadaceae bacterium]